MLRAIPMGGDIPAGLQEFRALRDGVEQRPSDAEVLGRELRRARDETFERLNVVATLQKATEVYSQELTAAKFQQMFSSKERPKPDATLVAELQRCPAELRQQTTLARAYTGQRDRL